MEKFKPREYQLAAIKRGINDPYLGLFLDMGLGKTAIALSVVEYLAFKEIEIGRVLLVAPKTVVRGVWQDEADKWKHTSKIQIIEVLGTEKQRKKALATAGLMYAINYENFAWLCGQYGGNMLPFDMIIFDESSKMKSSNSIRFKAADKATRNTSRIMLLTGTPAPNGYIDLWSQLFLLDRGDRLNSHITHFRSRYFNSERGLNYTKYTLQAGADKVIEDKIKDICISLSAKDCIELPSISYIDKKMYLSDAIYKKYKEFERDKVLEIADKMAIKKANDIDVCSAAIVAANAAALRIKLLQFSNGAVYYGDDAFGNKRIGYEIIHDEKIDYLMEIIEAAQGRPVLVAYSFKHDVDRIVPQLLKAGYKTKVYKGNAERDAWNSKQLDVLVANPASAAYGLNLQFGGSIIVWYGLTDNLEHYEQFNKRLHRSGQVEPVRIIRIIVRGTEDVKVAKNLENKGHTQANLMESLKAKFEEYL